MDYLPSKRDKVMIYKECGLCQYAVVGSTRQLKVAIGRQGNHRKATIGKQQRRVWTDYPLFNTLTREAYSDEPERLFSMAGNLFLLRSSQLKGESVEQMLCLRSWLL
jgi:hypothetical protein